MAAIDDKRRRCNVSGVLKILGVSRNGYYSFKHRKPSERQKHKKSIEDKIIDIYDKSHKNYGAPKITQKLHEIGEERSEKTIGNYMRELGIKTFEGSSLINMRTNNLLLEFRFIVFIHLQHLSFLLRLYLIRSRCYIRTTIVYRHSNFSITIQLICLLQSNIYSLVYSHILNLKYLYVVQM